MTQESDTAVLEPDEVEQRLEIANQRRLVEALLFTASEPVLMSNLRSHLPDDADLGAILEDLQTLYAGRGIALERHGDAWAFRTATDLAPVLTKQVEQPKKLTRAALETLAIIAYHQPVTRGEIETIRGVAVSRGALDTLLEQGWIKPGRRRDSPGRPVTWLTTPAFLDHFDLKNINDLPGIDELKAAGLLDARPAVTALAEQFPDGVDDAAAAEAEAAAEATEAEAHAVELGSVLADDAEEDGFVDTADYGDEVNDAGSMNMDDLGDLDDPGAAIEDATLDEVELNDIDHERIDSPQQTVQ